MELRVLHLCVLQNLSDFCAQIALQKSTEFRIDTFLKLGFKLCRRQLLFFQVTGDKLRKHQTAIEEAGKFTACVAGKRRPRGPVARRPITVTPGRTYALRIWDYPWESLRDSQQAQPFLPRQLSARALVESPGTRE